MYRTFAHGLAAARRVLMAEPAKVAATPGPPPLVTAWIAGMGICSCPNLQMSAVFPLKAGL
jgi:hypothetical protein